MKVIEYKENTNIGAYDKFILYCSASWCGPCRRIKPDLLDWLMKKQSNRGIVFLVDIDKHKDLAQLCKVTQIPQFVFFSSEPDSKDYKTHRLLSSNIKEIKEKIDAFFG